MLAQNLPTTGRGGIETRKTQENTWPNGFVLGILRFLIGLFCGSLIGLLAGAVNWAIVATFRYPFRPTGFDVFIGACVGVTFGFLLGAFAGVLPRAWPAGLLLSLLASFSATYYLVSLNLQPNVDASLQFGLPTLCSTAVIWFGSGWLIWFAMRKMFDEIRARPRGQAAIAYYCALGLYYLALGGYWLFYYLSYREFYRRH